VPTPCHPLPTTRRSGIKTPDHAAVPSARPRALTGFGAHAGSAHTTPMHRKSIKDLETEVRQAEGELEAATERSEVNAAAKPDPRQPSTPRLSPSK
jgi:hypothetical protein